MNSQDDLKQRLSIIDQILQGSIWSPRFPVNRGERIERLAHPRHDPLPKKSGIYQIQMLGAEVLAYVGQSQDLRRRINELRDIDLEMMPFTDPHIGGPSLWAWKQFPPHAPYAVSFAAIECSAYWQKGFKDLVIAHARWDARRNRLLREERWRAAYSPLANFHKMPDGWISSSSRAVGYRGGKVLFQTENHAPSIMPVGDLDDQRDPITDLTWGGHAWTPWCSVEKEKVADDAQGLYRLRKSDEKTLHFIGYGSIGDALRKARRAEKDLLFSSVTGSWSYHEQLELVTDALGLYLCRTGSLPRMQYGGEENPRAGSSWSSLSSFTTQIFSLLTTRFTRPELAIA